ncbi:VpaChn25_0724 family phage protein [Rhizobium mayense]|uniref:ArsR family transcriptional regulator n=1 Tax=Rhizobium mayense TaxID=1312184 RepID=A0ABT7JZC2_9HYPH|nr:hypothetical protein [Rhizobium mayense]MDL2401267.1 hypothetical protein [Rhizobium mayense]
MSLADEYKDWRLENVRLIILKALAAERGGVMNDYGLSKELEAFGHRKTTDFVRNQLLWLEEEAGAVRTRVIGTAMMAELTKTGRDHVERRHQLIGVQAPGDPD